MNRNLELIFQIQYLSRCAIYQKKTFLEKKSASALISSSIWEQKEASISIVLEHTIFVMCFRFFLEIYGP